jgi:hypothetical protein
MQGPMKGADGKIIQPTGKTAKLEFCTVRRTGVHVYKKVGKQLLVLLAEFLVAVWLTLYSAS